MMKIILQRMCLFLLVGGLFSGRSLAIQDFSLANNAIQINVRVGQNGISLTEIKDVSSGQTWLTNPTELFELSDGTSVWHSDTGIILDSKDSGTNSWLTVQGHTQDQRFQLEVQITVPAGSDPATISGWIKNVSKDWFGPFLLGDAGSSPVFPVDAELAPVRRTSDKEEVLVIGFDGLIYTSEETNNGPWSIPRSLQPTDSQFRNLFPPGAPIAAIRRNDHQGDAFAISKDGRLFTVFRVDGNWWSNPLQISQGSSGPFQPGGAVAALSVDEHSDAIAGLGPRLNEVDVFGLARTGQVLESSEINDGPFSEPVALAFQDSQTPIGNGAHLAAVKRNQTQQDLFTVDVTGALRTTFHLSGNTQWSNWITLAKSNVIAPNSLVAAVRGSGDDEFVFLVGRGPDPYPSLGSIYEIHELNDSAWSDLSPIGSPVPNLLPGSAISAVRRSGGEIDVFAVLNDGTIGLVTRRLDGTWTPFSLLPAARMVSGRARIASILRSRQQLDVFGISLDSGRLWTAADGLGSSRLRAVFPKIIFSGKDSLAGAFGMVPQEIGSLTQLVADGEFNTVGMPYANDPIAGDIGLPQAMNSLEVANIARNGRSLFFADLKGSVEQGRAPIQFTLGPNELDGFWATQIKGQQQVAFPAFAIGVADGDFRHSIDFYLAHHSAERRTPDTPRWLREAGAIYAPSGGGYGGIFLEQAGQGVPLPEYASSGCADSPPGFRCVLRRMRSEAEELGSNVLYLGDYWQGNGGQTPDCVGTPLLPYGAPYFCKGDYIIREDLGGVTELRAAIDEVHQLGCGTTAGKGSVCESAKVILYLEPFISFPTSFVGSAYGKLWGSRTGFPPDGPHVWVPFGASDGSLGMSQANGEWQNHIVEIARTLIEQTHADGIFLDSGGWRLNIPSWTKQEVVFNSSIENAMAVLNLVDRVRSAIRAVNPNAVVLSETTSGPMWRHVDGGVSADFNTSGGPFTGNETIGGRLLTSPTRYALPQINFFSNGQNLNQLNQIFATGHSLALCTNWVASDRSNWIHDNAAYIGKLVRTRKEFASALVYGKQTSQLDVTGDNGSSAEVYFYQGSPPVVIIVNPSDNGVPFTGKIPAQNLMGVASRWRDALSGEQFVVGVSGLTLSVPPPQAANGTCSDPAFTSCGLRILVAQPPRVQKHTPVGN